MDPINLFKGYAINLKRLTENAPLEDRAVALTWVFHLIGDAHQPLHAASLFTKRFQKDAKGNLVGDSGGTRFLIRAREGAAIIHLHHFWDGLVQGSDRFQAVRNRAKELWLRPAFARSKLPELAEKNFENWAAKESLKLAREVAYSHNGELLDGSPNRSEALVLPEGYAERAQAVAERRAVLAGYRLADVLKKTFE